MKMESFYESSYIITFSSIISISIILTNIINKLIDKLIDKFYMNNYVYQPSNHYTTGSFMHNNCDNSYDTKDYTPISDELVQYILNTKDSVVEMCAGGGDNAEKLRKSGIIVHAYDIKSIENKVEYGICGIDENNYSDNILMICSGFDCLRSINNFKGNILIIGGFVQTCVVENNQEYIDSLSNPIPRLINSDSIFKLQLRPSFTEIVNLGWKFEKSFFNPTGGVKWQIAHAFYVFKR